jgi:signal transduction histidine kinase
VLDRTVQAAEEERMHVAAELHDGPIQGDRVDLKIRDDGVGFEPQAASDLVRDGHFGLVAMQERVEMAGGRFQVDAHPGVRVRAMFRVSPAA